LAGCAGAGAKSGLHSTVRVRPRDGR
jgi:hypothetical protein